MRIIGSDRQTERERERDMLRCKAKEKRTIKEQRTYLIRLLVSGVADGSGLRAGQPADDGNHEEAGSD